MMRRGSVESMWLVEVEVRACVWAGSTGADAVLSRHRLRSVGTMETVVARFFCSLYVPYQYVTELPLNSLMLVTARQKQHHAPTILRSPLLLHAA